MKFVTVLIGISSVVVGLHSLAAQEQDEVEEAEDVQKDDQQATGEIGRFGYAQANAMASVPMFRPQPNPAPSNMIECYACSGCPNILPNTTSKLCSYSLDPTKQKKCVVYAEKYTYMKSPWYIRGCASERGSCEDIRRAHAAHNKVVKLLKCYECEGNKCNTNSGSLSFIDITMAFFAMVVTPLVAKYTLA